MHATRNIGLAVAAAAVMLAAVTDLRAAPPVSLTVGGTIVTAPDGMSSTDAVWRVYPFADSTVSVTGTVGSLAADVWEGEIGVLADSIPVGSDCLVIVYPGKDALRQALLTEQRGLCCYCMSRIHNGPASMKIEHWHCQDCYDGEKLDYQNMLGACLGGQGQPPRLHL